MDLPESTRAVISLTAKGAKQFAEDSGLDSWSKNFQMNSQIFLWIGADCLD